MNDDRATGKTTRLMESAVSYLAELPEEAKVFVTTPHTKWLVDLRRRFKDAGLVDVVFLTLPQIKSGALRGCIGVLLVDDPQDVKPSDWDFIVHERRYLESKIRRQ